MKKVRSWLVLAIAASIVLSACAAPQAGPAPQPTSVPQAAASQPSPAAPATAAPAATPFKVCLIYNTPVGDMGWNYAIDQGRQALEKNIPGVKTIFTENTPAGADAQRVLASYPDQGCNMVIGTGYDYMDPISQLAPKNPKMTWENYAQQGLGPNIGSHRVRGEEGWYLTGMLAGKMTKSNVIGIVSTFPIPQIIKDVDAFTLGARSVNPNAKVKVVWVNSWYDLQKSTEAANGLIAAGADVLAGDTTDPSVLQAADAKNVYSVGYVNDLSKFAPNKYLASAVLNWGPLYTKLVKMVQDGSWKSAERWFNMADGVVNISPYGASVPDDVRKLVDAKRQEIIDGKFDVYQGPIKDQAGNLKVPEGSKLSHDQIINLDWCVEGVDGTCASK